MVGTLPFEISKLLPSFVKGFTRALGELADGLSNRGGFPDGITFSKKIFLYLRPTNEFFP